MRKLLGVLGTGLLCLIGAPAFADNKPPCTTPKETKDLHDAAVKPGTNGKPAGEWTVLSPAQFHFAEGIWVGLPPMGGVPPGDGAVIVAMHGDSGGLLMFTRNGVICPPAVPIPAKVIDLFSVIKTGPINTGTGDEM